MNHNVKFVQIKMQLNYMFHHNHSLSLVETIYDNTDREILTVIGLADNPKPTVVNIVNIGNLNYTQSTPREVFKPLVLSNSQAFILVHNHVYERIPRPSPGDIRSTRRLSRLGHIMDILLWDHIVLSDNLDFYSFMEHGLLPK